MTEMNVKRAKHWIYTAPALLLILVVLIFPIIYTGYISLTNMSLFHWKDYQFIGLDNYKRALFKFDSGFISALLCTVVWTVLNMAIQLIVSFFLALGLNQLGARSRKFYKTLLMFPWAMPAYISILLWRVGMYNSSFGLINKLLAAMGLSKVEFLSNNTMAFISCLVLNLWMAMPFMIATMDGALQSIDSSYYESALLDGASFFQKIRYITVPAIKPIVAPAAVMTTFITVKQFDIVYLLTQQKGYMTGATFNTVITYAHQNAFVSNNYGLSSAVSILLFVIIIIFSLFTNRSLKEEWK